ncbi:hypothetical protein [Rhizobium sp. RU36D]|uniref:hypothetical protein n=1 Tax=Rhizobium sp. RU36D TaxID=1907415 RepID=UPI0009D7ABA9|nr:hypothetical protein [Rhizobium sp. RU36D]SMC58795.1 hypothetical protein SAMN05880593_10390 [Rhizobium sp. RU36D]
MANSIFRNAYNRVIEARERQANRYVNGALMNLDDKTLASMGLTREELRRKGTAAYIF